VVDVLTVEERIKKSLTEATMEGNQKVVKRSGSDEPMWAAIHKCMETMLESLCIAVCISN
jgi:ribosome-associated translation inhibitor RaiA